MVDFKDQGFVEEKLAKPRPYGIPRSFPFFRNSSSVECHVCQSVKKSSQMSMPSAFWELELSEARPFLSCYRLRARRHRSSK